jgi:hypothetical protein
LEFHSGHEADHSPPSSAEVKRMGGTVPPFPQYAFMAWCSVRGSTGGQLYLYVCNLQRKCFNVLL